MNVPTRVLLWGRTIGAVFQPEGDPVASFQYDPAFARSRIEVSPIVMPLSTQVYRFRDLARPPFSGLPGLLADALPDRFGNAVINTWLARQGRLPDSFSAIDRLGYMGRRAMGALTFEPATGPDPSRGQELEVAALVELASDILAARQGLSAQMPADDPTEGLLDILQVGTSAGGARAKALIAWNPTTNQVRSGQIEAGSGFSYWLLKFDGVDHNRDRELADPQGFGAIEYAYHRMATAAGLIMSPCHLLQDKHRRHFMTRRFDRTPTGGRLHMQSLGALAHLDFNQAGAHGYERAFAVMRSLGLPKADMEQQFRRMVFNLVARNQDDHVKNIAYLMDQQGNWSLSPAFDVTWAYNPDGDWTSRHQMTVNGKRDGFVFADLAAVAAVAALKRGRARAILDEVVEVVAQWPGFAADAGVGRGWIARIGGSHRLAMG